MPGKSIPSGVEPARVADVPQFEHAVELGQKLLFVEEYHKELAGWASGTGESESSCPCSRSISAR